MDATERARKIAKLIGATDSHNEEQVAEEIATALTESEKLGYEQRKKIEELEDQLNWYKTEREPWLEKQLASMWKPVSVEEIFLMLNRFELLNPLAMTLSNITREQLATSIVNRLEGM